MPTVWTSIEREKKQYCSVFHLGCIGSCHWNLHLRNLLKKYPDLSFILCSLIGYAINTYFIKPNTSILFFHYYMNDILAGILFISYVNFICILCRFSYRMKEHFAHAIVFMLVVGCIWESDLSFLGIHNTSDLWDILCYLTGTMINLCISFLHKPKKVTTL